MKLVARILALLLMLGTSVNTAQSQGKSTTNNSATRGFTIQQALSAAFPSELTAAPAKGRIAWVFNAESRRNIWISEPAKDGKSYASRQITKYSEDDGQDVGELSWAPDAESIVYVYGGDLEFSEKPYPNPAKNARGVEQDVWVVSLDGGEPRKLGEGHSPAVSPKGDAVAYVSKGQIWIAKITGNDKPEQLIHSRGESNSLRWSPDGRYLAFVSDREDHSFIGIYSHGSKVLNYLDPSTDQDTNPVWSPDSKQVAFLRTPSSKERRIFEPKRAGAPWSIRVCQIGGEGSREVWKATEGSGSVIRDIVADNQLFWAAGDRIVFPWEKDGWTHLYSFGIAGGSATLLTPGAFEVEYASLSPDRKTIVYSSNQDDIDRRHLWRVAADGTRPEALTSGTGIETAPVISSDNQAVAMLRSDARLPMQPAILSRPNEIRDLARSSIPADFPAAQLEVPQQVIFSSADGVQIHGSYFCPPMRVTGGDIQRLCSSMAARGGKCFSVGTT